MIIKSISHSQKQSARTLINYVFDGRKSLEDEKGNRLLFKQLVKSYQKEKWIQQFEELEANRQSHYGTKSVVCYHEVVSFSDKSTQHLNRSILKDLVERYIKLRTDQNMLCVGAVHFEKNRNWHAHLVFSGLRTTDYKSARISKKRMAEIKVLLQQYQINTYPLLEDSVVRHGLKKKN